MRYLHSYMHACTYDIWCYVWFHSFKKCILYNYVKTGTLRTLPFQQPKNRMVFPIAQEVLFVQWNHIIMVEVSVDFHSHMPPATRGLVWFLVLVIVLLCCFNVWMAVSHDAFLILATPSRTSATKPVSRSFLARIVWRWIDSTCGKRCLCWLFHVYLWRSVVDTFSLCIQLRFKNFYI